MRRYLAGLAGTVLAATALATPPAVGGAEPGRAVAPADRRLWDHLTTVGTVRGRWIDAKALAALAETKDMNVLLSACPQD